MATIEERYTSEGLKTFRVKVRLKGKPIQTATFERLTDAKKWAASTESAIRENRYFKTAESKKHAFADMVERYIETILPQKPKSKDKQETQLNWWKSHLGGYVLADIAELKALANYIRNNDYPIDDTQLVKIMADRLGFRRATEGITDRLKKALAS